MRFGEKTIIAFIGIELLISVALYIFLPDSCAIHWSQEGTDYRDKIAIFALPLTSVIIAAISIVASRWYSKRDKVYGETIYHMFVLMSFVVITVSYIGLLVIFLANL